GNNRALRVERSEHDRRAEATEENLVLRPGVTIRVSVMAPSGGGARDPGVLLMGTMHHFEKPSLISAQEYRGYDTYDGQNRASGPDWYAIEFPEPFQFNCIEMTTGPAYRDGGWWLSLNVEVRDEIDEAWRQVEHLTITPPYDFEDSRAERRYGETFALTFEPVTVRAARIVGTPGGLAQFTSLLRLAVYHRDLSQWNPARLPEPPVPYVFQLIAPGTIWDLSEKLTKLTDLVIEMPWLEYYLDGTRYKKYWQRLSKNYQGEPELWFFIGNVLGWDTWQRTTAAPEPGPAQSRTEPYVRLFFHDTFGTAIAPIVVESRVISEMSTYQVIVRDHLDEVWHRHYAADHDLPWSEYQAAIERSPHMTLEQLEGAAELLGMIANTIANLAHRNRSLERELEGTRGSAGQRTLYRREIVRKAIDFMQSNLEEPVGVAETARAVRLSLPYFCTLFAEQTGHNPGDYLIELRLERAKEYLAQTRMSVMDVCVALGYSPSYFSRLFKLRVGCTPGQYARKMRRP
ncbi:MAG TPA: helix-turn-helix domain-containing protein, partial [Aggregatilineaceae bacterium]|nr:helix-turn-helix domain-containing protein [Aggregatilineaceae bacterium]